MKYIFFALSMLVASAHALVIEVDGQADLDTKLKQHAQAVVKFYRPGCPACKQIGPDYIRISNNLPGVTFLAVNTSSPANSAVYPQWGVRGVPTLFFVKNGARTEYKRDRNFAASFEKAVKEHFSK